MTAILAIALVLLVAGFVAWPLLGQSTVEEDTQVPGADEWWRREKAVAMLAIREADFDRATGKLTDEDYRVLLSDYEDRALHAMGELEKAAPAAAEEAGAMEGLARFCPACGTPFGAADRFCGGCGRARAAA